MRGPLEFIRKNRPQSTFWKLTRSFILFGLVPMALICLMFFLRYSIKMESMTVNSMVRMSELLEENLEDLFTSLDEVMEYIYEYQNSNGDFLYEIIEDETMDEQERTIYIQTMLQSMLAQNSYISSIRLVQEDMTAYAAYYNQEKSVSLEPAFCDPRLYPAEELYHDLKITPCTSEDYYTSNSSDYTFSLVRNYMDISTTKNAKEKVVATLYVDVNESVISAYVDAISQNLTGQLYIYNPNDGNYMYSADIDDFRYDAEDPLESYKKEFTDDAGVLEIGNLFIAYNKLGDTDYYIVNYTSVASIRSTYMDSLSLMLVLLVVALFFLITLYSIYSGRLSEPTRQLKRAMQEVQVGNFDVRLDIHTNDEMEYLGDGFNKMIRALKYYIDQVYVARLYRSQAELNTLKGQIRPHYLYNTLDVIRMTALENGDEKTAELLESLSAQMRYITRSDEETVELRSEIENIREYYTIVKVRYKNKILFKINVKDEDLHLKVLKLILQPIVENAIKHGLVPKGGEGTVEVDVNRESDALYITVMDDGVGMSAEKLKELRNKLIRTGKNDDSETSENKGHGIGLKNIADLIRMNYGVEYGTIIDSYENVGTIVKLKLPILDGEE